LKNPVSNTATHWRAASCRDTFLADDRIVPDSFAAVRRLTLHMH
jgi:hypothetical protein